MMKYTLMIVLTTAFFYCAGMQANAQIDNRPIKQNKVDNEQERLNDNRATLNRRKYRVDRKEREINKKERRLDNAQKKIDQRQPVNATPIIN